ncbi:MAG: hypothetical protein ACTHLE_10955 [Agriterribacter sp.]
MLKKVASYYRSLNKFYFFFFISGFLTGLIFYFYSEDKYEQDLFRVLSTNAKKLAESNNIDTDSNAILISSLNLVHELVSSSRVAFQDKKINSFKSDIVNPLTVDLMTGQGACGSYSLVMARLLDELKLETRIIQMKVGNLYGGHIILEAKNGGRWVVFDPLYNLYFKRPDGTLASFEDVSKDWASYKTQVPAGYDQNYRYEGKQYTNWNKIPVLMPALKKMLDWTIGKENADTLSLRILVLRKFRLLFLAALATQLLLIFYMFYYTYNTYKKQKLAIISNKKNTQKGVGKVNIRVVNSGMTSDHIDS